MEAQIVPELAVAGILLQGISCGIMLATVIGIFPMMQRMSYTQYTASVQFLWPRFDPVMPILNISVTLVYMALSFAPGRALTRVLFGTSVALLLVVIVISVAKNVPINKAVKAMNPHTRPDRWADVDPRAQWRKWNLIRTLLAVTALLIAGCGSVSVLTT